MQMHLTCWSEGASPPVPLRGPLEAQGASRSRTATPKGREEGGPQGQPGSRERQRQGAQRPTATPQERGGGRRTGEMVGA